MADEPPDGGHEDGWSRHRREQRLRLAQLPLSEKIRWLEEAQRTVESLVQARATRVRPSAGSVE